MILFQYGNQSISIHGQRNIAFNFDLCSQTENIGRAAYCVPFYEIFHRPYVPFLSVCLGL